jgi:hypothetical protein
MEERYRKIRCSDEVTKNCEVRKGRSAPAGMGYVNFNRGLRI